MASGRRFGWGWGLARDPRLASPRLASLRLAVRDGDGRIPIASSCQADFDFIAPLNAKGAANVYCPKLTGNIKF